MLLLLRWKNVFHYSYGNISIRPFQTAWLPSSWYQTHRRRKTYLQPCLILPRWTSLDPSALSFLTLPAMVTSSPLLFSSPLLCPLISFSFSLLSTGFTSSCVVPSPPSPSSPLLLLCCVHVGSDSLQKGGLQPRHLTLGLQGQYQACSWWRECKYCVACIQSLYASAR